MEPFKLVGNLMTKPTQQMYKNESDIPIIMAVWLAHDEYDYVDDPNYISATTLLDSTRKIILSGRVQQAATQPIVDIRW
jgi:hypothetical protein